MDIKEYERIMILKVIEEAKKSKGPAKWTGPTIPYTELKEDPSGRKFAREWNCYVRAVARLLAEGNEGRWVLIAGDEIIGIYDTQREVTEVWAQRFQQQDSLIHQISTREPLIRLSTRLRLCLS